MPGELQRLQGLGDLRRSYLGVALPAAAGVFLLVAVGPGLGPEGRAVRVATALLLLLLRWRLPASRDGGLLIARASVALSVAVVVGAAVAHPAGHFPNSLSALPAIAVFATLLGGTASGFAVVAAGLASGLAFLLLPPPQRPPLLQHHLTNFFLCLAVAQAIAAVLARELLRGAAGLAASAEALRAAREVSAELARTLSERVKEDVATLRQSLGGPRDRTRGLLQSLSAALSEARRRLPPEPDLPEPQLAQRLAGLRRGVTDWYLGVGLLAMLASLVRVAQSWPREFLLPNAVATGAWALFAPLVLLRRRWARPLISLQHLASLTIGALNVFRWRAVDPGLPPNLVAFDLFALLGVVTVGLALGAADLALMVGAVSASIWLLPGLPWTVPLVNAATTGIACWALWRLPRDLLEGLRASREEAAAGIRLRRRMVATLFHDLAGVLTAACFLAEEPSAGEGDEAALRRMVDRLAEIVVAAEGRSKVRAVPVQPLCEAMEQLLRERLRRKGLSLRVEAPSAVLVRCDETLLRESVLGNLMTNAVKFSPAGGAIDLRVLVEGARVMLEVSDRGPGLAADVREALAREAPAPSHPGSQGELGSGFGLLLAREHLRSMGGSLELADREGGGLCARVTLAAG